MAGDARRGLSAISVTFVKILSRTSFRDVSKRGIVYALRDSPNVLSSRQPRKSRNRRVVRGLVSRTPPR